MLAAAKVYTENEEEGMVVLRQIIRDVDFANGVLLKYLCEFLTEVAANHTINKMTYKNLVSAIQKPFIFLKKKTNKNKKKKLIPPVFIQPEERKEPPQQVPVLEVGQPTLPLPFMLTAARTLHCNLTPYSMTLLPRSYHEIGRGICTIVHGPST